MVWSVSTGMEARMFNVRAVMNWDVPFVGHPSMSSGEIAGLVEKPANWKKVYAIGYKSCSYDASGKLPPKSLIGFDTGLRKRTKFSGSRFDISGR